MSSQARPFTALESARALFSSNDLAFPPLPSVYADQLQEIGDNLYATTPIPDGPYNIDLFANAISESGMDENYVLLGMDGRGINSWAMHYYIVQPGLALFIQKAWGGAYIDAASARQKMADAFNWAKDVQDRVGSLNGAGRIKPGFHLALQTSDFAGARWACVPFANITSGSEGTQAIAWAPLRDIRKETNAILDRIEAGELP